MSFFGFPPDCFSILNEIKPIISIFGQNVFDLLIFSDEQMRLSVLFVRNILPYTGFSGRNVLSFLDLSDEICNFLLFGEPIILSLLEPPYLFSAFGTTNLSHIGFSVETYYHFVMSKHFILCGFLDKPIIIS